MTREARLALLHDDHYPLAAKYDAGWMYDNRMGSPTLLLTEALARAMRLERGMRVLDLGCGTALSSIFLAKEYGVTVFAADLWTSVDDNWARASAAGVGERVFPLRAETHALPFARGFFDAVVSVNAFQFFATDDFYLGEYLAPLLRQGGQLGIAVYGPAREFAFGEVPPQYAKDWWPDFHYFHSMAWWRWHIERTRLFDIDVADDLAGDGARVARLWARVMEKEGDAFQDGGMGWNRLVATRNGHGPDDFRI